MAEMSFLRSVPYLTAPSKRIWVDYYDDEADVLYISFHKPQQANDSIMEDDVIYHYRDKELVHYNTGRVCNLRTTNITLKSAGTD